MEPHFLPFEEAESGVSTEIRRFQNNITRISIAMRGINRFMKTLNDLFGWWDVGKTLVVVTIGLYIIWMVRRVRAREFSNHVSTHTHTQHTVC